MNFEAEFEKLNPEQKEAVNSIDGPVLVIAGPGTGKTQLLSMRVANILKTTDTDARNILCLTFTNKAATNMRERLQKLTDGEARYVNVKTFHSFCSDAMNNYPEYFWNGANLSSAPDSVQYSILEDIFSQLPLENPYASKFYGQYTMLKKAKSQISRAKEAGLTPDKLRVILTANLAYIDTIEPMMVDILSKTLSYKKLPELKEAIDKLPAQAIEEFTSPLIGLETKIKEGLAFAISQDEGTNKTTNTGKWKSGWVTAIDKVKGLHRERKNNNNWLILSDIYEAYRNELHKRGFYDYSDMLLEVIVQIENNSFLKAEIQERYNYVLIDEFQDSNAAQLRLAHLIADHHSSENKPNIMAVGDDDQSIYGFNGAELNNMLYFQRTYDKKAVRNIVLKENYRSTKQVLETANNIIKNSEDRLVNRIPGLSKDLVAKADDLPSGEIIHNQFLTKEQQYFEVASQIQKIKENNAKASVAVLARKHQSLEKVAARLNALNVAIKYERSQNILKNQSVVLIIEILRLIQDIITGDQNNVNARLCTLLRHPAFSLEPQTIWKIATENRYDAHWLASMLENEETKELAEWFNWLASEATFQPLTVLVEHVLGISTETPQSYLQEYFINDRQISHDYIETLSAIKLLRDQASEFSLNKQPSLGEFIDFIETEENNNQVISNSSPLITGDDCVELLSVHKAKGLEFDIVFILDCVESAWQPKNSKEPVPANLPLHPPLESEDEYTRLMYVAATRAKYSLYFTSFTKDESGQEVLSTPLISTVEVREVNKPKTDEIIEILEDSISWPRFNITDEKLILKNTLENFTINPTNLMKFLNVAEGGPAHFLESSLLILPQVKSDFMSHGTAMHAALELAQKLTNLSSFDLEKIKQEYKRSLIKQNLPKDRVELQLQYGEAQLGKLFNKLNYKLFKGSQPEQNLKNIQIGEAKIGGKLDRIDFINEDSINIIDYKTGNGLSSFETKDKTKQIKAWQHKLQLTFYALLAKNHPDYHKYKNISGQMDYIEADTIEKVSLSYTPDQEDIDRLGKIIQAVHKLVSNYDLPDVSQYEPSIQGILEFEQWLIDNN